MSGILMIATYVARHLASFIAEPVAGLIYVPPLSGPEVEPDPGYTFVLRSNGDQVYRLDGAPLQIPL